MSRYRVFELNTESEEWTDKEWVEAVNQQTAIRHVADGDEGVYFVVPSRSFHPVRVVETMRVISRKVEKIDVGHDDPDAAESSEELAEEEVS